MDPRLIFGLIAGFGAVARGVYSFLNKKKEDPSLKWSWVAFSTEAVASFAFGFFAGAALDTPFTAYSAISAFFMGMGFTSALSKGTKAVKLSSKKGC